MFYRHLLGTNDSKKRAQNTMDRIAAPHYLFTLVLFQIQTIWFYFSVEHTYTH